VSRVATEHIRVKRFLDRATVEQVMSEIGHAGVEDLELEADATVLHLLSKSEDGLRSGDARLVTERLLLHAGDSSERRARRWRIDAPSATHAAPSSTICSEVIGKCGESTRRATMPLKATLIISGS
jgi:hypothetical protein